MTTVIQRYTVDFAQKEFFIMSEFDLQIFCTNWNRYHKDIRFYLSVNNLGNPCNVMVNCNKKLYGEAIHNIHYVNITSTVTERSDGAMTTSSSREMSSRGILEFNILSEYEGYNPKRVADTLEWIASIVDPAVVTNPTPAAQ